MITAWWESLDLLMKVLWGITLSASLIFVIQSVMTFVGLGGGEGSFDGDFSSDFNDLSTMEADPGMNLYTFRNLVNFLLGFGWTAILMHDRMPLFWLMVLAVAVGVALVAVVMYLFKWLHGMQQSGNIDVFHCGVGCQGRVYLTVPAERKGEGQVQITISGSVREYNAVTDGDEIKTGTPIEVVEVLNSNTLVVEPLPSLIV